jgi:hypothetical protein
MDKKSESEIREMLEWEEVHEEREEPRRWTQTVLTVVKHPETGELWGVEWERGLTEMQENMFEEQPYRVESYEEIIPATTVTKWRKKAPETVEKAPP